MIIIGSLLWVRTHPLSEHSPRTSPSTIGAFLVFISGLNTSFLVKMLIEIDSNWKHVVGGEVKTPWTIGLQKMMDAEGTAFQKEFSKRLGNGV